MHTINDTRISNSTKWNRFVRAPRRGALAACVVACSVLAVPLSADAGGTVKGRVLFSGKVPSPKEFVFAKFPNPAFCAKNPNKSEDGKVRLLKEITVAKDGGLQDAIVAVRDLNDDAWMKSYKGTQVSAELCEWSTFTGVAVNKGRFIVENHDADPDDPKSVSGVLHNPHAFEIKKPSALTLFNIGLAKKGDKLDKTITLRKIKAGSVVRLQCDQHEFMQAWFLPVTNPHFVQVKENGMFELADVPAGKHKLMAWHPIAGMIEKEVAVPEGGSVTMEFNIK